MRLVTDRKYDIGPVRCVTLVHPPIMAIELFPEDFDAFHTQGFSWHPNRVKFKVPDENSWLTVFEAGEARVKPDSERAILVPFEVPKEGELNISGVDEFSIEVPTGQYQLLFEYRRLNLDEIRNTDKYREAFSDYLSFIEEHEEDYTEPVGLCILTFIKTQNKIEPKLLTFFPWRDDVDVATFERIKRGEIGQEEYAPDTIVMFDEPFVED